MKCPRCQHENPAGMKFCGECGARLESACAACGAANSPGNKFCGHCGESLASSPTSSKSTAPDSYTPKHLAEKILTSKGTLVGERKQVTVLFADMKGSMELLADHDPEEARKLLTLDKSLESTLPAFLALLDVPVDDPMWQALDPSQRRQQTLGAVKRLLLRESQVQPLILLFEDLHWIDSETQAFLDSLIESLPITRFLLLVNYRPEYQHNWGRKTYYSQIRIDPSLPESAMDVLGADADLIVVDLKRRATITKDILQTVTPWSVYEGREVTAWAVMTVVRGNIVMEWPEGAPRAKVTDASLGQYLKRKVGATA